MATRALHRLAVGLAALAGASCAGSPSSIWWDETAPLVISSDVECGVHRHLIESEGAWLRSNARNPPAYFYIDPRGGPGLESADPDSEPFDIREILPNPGELDRATAVELGTIAPSTRYVVDCDWEDLPVLDARRSMWDHPRNQPRLQFPRMSVSRPIISADGQWAFAGYHWNLVPRYGEGNTRLLQRDGSEWRTVECMMYPLEIR